MKEAVIIMGVLCICCILVATMAARMYQTERSLRAGLEADVQAAEDKAETYKARIALHAEECENRCKARIAWCEKKAALRQGMCMRPVIEDNELADNPTLLVEKLCELLQ